MNSKWSIGRDRIVVPSVRVAFCAVSTLETRLLRSPTLLEPVAQSRTIPLST